MTVVGFLMPDVTPIYPYDSDHSLFQMYCRESSIKSVKAINNDYLISSMVAVCTLDSLNSSSNTSLVDRNHVDTAPRLLLLVFAHSMIEMEKLF